MSAEHGWHFPAPGARDKALANQAAGKPIAPTLKVLSPFHFLAECLQISNFITWQRHIEGLVAGGAQHLELHPELVDDKNFKVTREMLGGFCAGDREFNFLNQRMNDFGFSLEPARLVAAGKAIAEIQHHGEQTFGDQRGDAVPWA